MTVQAKPKTAARRRFTAEEFHRMAEAGIFAENDRLELIDGEIIVMSPIGPAHMHAVLQLDRLFNERILHVGIADVFVSVQNPLRLGPEQEPEPDVVLLHLPHGMKQIPGPEAALLAVEVADTTLDYDRQKAARYAAAGVPETWIVALEEDAVEVYRQPTDEGYAKRQRAERGEQLRCTALPKLDALPVETILGPPSN